MSSSSLFSPPCVRPSVRSADRKRKLVSHIQPRSALTLGTDNTDMASLSILQRCSGERPSCTHCQKVSDSPPCFARDPASVRIRSPPARPAPLVCPALCLSNRSQQNRCECVYDDVGKPRSRVKQLEDKIGRSSRPPSPTLSLADRPAHLTPALLFAIQPPWRTSSPTPVRQACSSTVSRPTCLPAALPSSTRPPLHRILTLTAISLALRKVTPRLIRRRYRTRRLSR